MNTTGKTTSGPKRYRIGIFLFSTVLTVLLLWLGNFVLYDIAQIQPPEIEDTALLKTQDDLFAEKRRLTDELGAATSRGEALSRSTRSSQTTLNQLIELHKSTLATEGELSEQAQAAFDTAQANFLRNQEQEQLVIAEIATLRTAQRTNQQALNDATNSIREKRRAIYQPHRRKVAFWQFLFVTPFALLGVAAFKKYRASPFSPLVHAFNIAVFILLITVVHEHFPSEYFKYMFLAVAIALVGGGMVYLIRQLIRPDKKWLLQRYREAYHAAQCPSCQYPIVGDNMRSVVPDKRLLKRKGALEIQGSGEEYSCPSCGTRLFHRCESCQSLRHTLLPHCLRCGSHEDQTSPNSSPSTHPTTPAP